MTDEIPLVGRVANAGKVVRAGAEVRRPANPYSARIHRFLGARRDTGFAGASRPLGFDAEGRERLEFVPGSVPVPPYPGWAQTDAALGSIADLVCAFHTAAGAVALELEGDGSVWSDEMVDPAGGRIVCHNDVRLENVVFRDGVALVLLDFDFAAPGQPIYDLAAMARMCARSMTTRTRRDSAGSRPTGPGDPNFAKMWEEAGGERRHEFRRRWSADVRDGFAGALA